MNLPRWVTSPHLASILAVLIFAANYVVGRGVREDTPPFTLGFFRWFGAAVILMPFALRGMRDDWSALAGKWRVIAASGFLMPVVGASFAYVALTTTTAINASVVQIALPVLTIPIAAVALRERITGPIALGCLIAIAGVLVIIMRGDPAILAEFRFRPGDLLILLAQLGLAGYAVLVKFAPRVKPLSLLLALCLLGTLYHLPFLAWELANGKFVAPGWTGIGGLAFVAVFPSICAIFLWNYGIERLGPSRSGIYMFLMPVFGAALAYVILGEILAWYHVFGTGLIVTGVMLTSWRSSHHPRLR
jgi:drug/metabolite transporter (DMT)-like permease